ncbi:hypothetical protein C834K_0202 [Chlamydia poikilotherma]|uniref:Uncharacterized protein n=1 Tax=Chlamydia poikilotherma TaxID=1967783 RepID=A0A3B0PNN4_9CHLA|nr:hypothetical protein [Chlamydia poikilotherma]SYX08680.1 hypothetical protein C834K_0202 [Chlamydia poikilotherma]
MHYLYFFALIASFLIPGDFSYAYSENFPWIAPKSLTILGSPFIDVVLDVHGEFIESCNLKIGEIQTLSASDVKKIFFMYKGAFPEDPIRVTRKEPLSLTEDQLANLGITSLRNGNPYFNYLKQTEYGPAFNELDQFRLVLRCPNQEDTLCYFFQNVPECSTELCLSPDGGYTLIDSELFISGYCIESFLKKTGNQAQKIMLDLNNSRIACQFRDRIWSLLPYIDVLFLSESSTEALTGISHPTIARRLLSRVIPMIFIQNVSEDGSRIYFIQNGKEAAYCSKQDLQQIVLGFLFGYINNNVVDYCFHSTDLLIDNA